MSEKLIIIGAGGQGKVVAEIAQRMNSWKEIFFLDDNSSRDTVLGIKVIGKSSDWFNYIDKFDIFVALGKNELRKKIISQLEMKKVIIPTLIDPSAILGREVVIGQGTVIMAGVVINCCTKIGKGCIINTSTSIDHDNHIGDYVHISPGVHVAGEVSIGDLSWIGIGCSIINGVSITANCVIGAGAVVVKNIVHKGTYIGVPAKLKCNVENERESLF